MVPRWGVLHSTRDILHNRYAGAVFVRMGVSGHMFNQHYMDAMFHFMEPERQRINDDAWIVDPFLDEVVNVDSDTILRRESTTLRKTGLKRTATGLEFGDGECVADGASANGIIGCDAVMTFGRTNSGRLMGDEGTGKTVRDLSRLWKYQGGRSPDDVVPGNIFEKVNGK